jgi:uncharacterized protein
MIQPPCPPFTEETALQKVRSLEDVWNTRDPGIVALAYTLDVSWRDRAVLLYERDQIHALLIYKWDRERDYCLINELWAFTERRIAVRLAYEYHDANDRWYRAYGNENWEFAEDGLMCRRFASISEHQIEDFERQLCWQPGRRPGEHPSLSDLGVLKRRSPTLRRDGRRRTAPIARRSFNRLFHCNSSNRDHVVGSGEFFEPEAPSFVRCYPVDRVM